MHMCLYKSNYTVQSKIQAFSLVKFYFSLLLLYWVSYPCSAANLFDTHTCFGGI